MKMGSMNGRKVKPCHCSTEYYVPGNVKASAGAVGNQVDNLKTRKLPGHIGTKPMVPHTRGA